ncbi:hypothetical protein [Thaumasiovibrio subtropicus]|uniref:hypothetical protein n=1 Tax=Thaumasiovibrio subtropicus TaxID=1891207 RepID=UPI000B34B6D1|nr:hypothetical protein [Thaumasiovibrio subtropicus]
MNILITGARAPVAVEWVNILRQAGNKHRVWLADSLRWPLGRFAKDIEGFFRYPAPRFTPQSCVHAIASFCQQQRIDLVIPTCEEVFHLSQYPHDQLPLFAPNHRLLSQLHNKYAALQLINNIAGVSVPETRLLQHRDQLAQYPDHLLKPVFSRFGEAVIYPGQCRANCQPSSTQPWVAQRMLDGEPICNYAIYTHGRLIAHQAYRPLWGLNGSAATAFAPYDNAELARFMQHFGQHTQYHGQVAFDFIEKDNQLFVIECNPRATSGLHLLAKGISLDSKGNWRTQPYKATLQHIGLPLFGLFTKQALQDNNFRGLLNTYRQGEAVLTEAALPPLASTLSFIALWVESLRQGCSLTRASTWDIEWNG